MAILNKIDKKELLEGGWLPSEIMQLMRAKTPSGQLQPHMDINSNFWKALRRSRIRYIADMKRLGWNDYEIKQKIINHYKKSKDFSVFAFLKSEYRQNERIADYEGAIKKSISHKRNKSSLLARKAITSGLGGFYGQRIGRRMPVKYMHPTLRRKLIRRVS